MEKIIENFLFYSMLVLKFFVIVLLAIMIVINLAEIIVRPLGGSIPWVFPLTLLLFVWLTFVGVALVFYKRATIRIMFFVHRLPTKFQKYINALAYFTVAAFMIFLLTTAPRIIKLELYPLELIPGPRYLFALPIFIGSFFILLVSLHRLYLIMRYAEDNGTQYKEGSSHSANIKKEKEK